MGGWRNTMWVRKNWLLWRFQKKLKLHPTPNSWNLLSCRRKNMLEYCQGRGSHLGSLFRIHPWGQATQSGQQCEPARTMEEEEKDSSALPVGRSRSVCGVCAEAHSKPGMAHGAVLGATSCSQGWLLWENIFPASTTTQCSIRSWRKAGGHAASKPPAQQTEGGILHQMWWTAHRREKLWLPWPIWGFFQSFERIFLWRHSF